MEVVLQNDVHIRVRAHEIMGMCNGWTCDSRGQHAHVVNVFGWQH